jgi:hypothetical protein
MKRKKDKKASQKLAKEKRAGSDGSEGLVVKEAGSSSTSNGRPSASSINDKGEVRFGKFEFEGLQKKKKGPTDAQGQLKMVMDLKKRLFNSIASLYSCFRCSYLMADSKHLWLC